MTGARPHDEERLAELLALLPPAPAGWVQAAQELPFARLDEIVERARADTIFRRRLLDDLEAALAAEGFEPAPGLVEALRRRLERD